MAATPKTRYRTSQGIFYQTVECQKGLKVEGSAVFTTDIVLRDNVRAIFGTDSDASVYFDGTRLTHANAEELFFKHVTIPLYGTTGTQFKYNTKKTPVFMPDRAAYVKSARVGWTQAPGTTDSIGIRFRVGKRAAATPTTTEWVLKGAGSTGSVDLSTIGTAYFGSEYDLTSDTDILTLAAGDFIFSSIELPDCLHTVGMEGGLTLEYEVYG